MTQLGTVRVGGDNHGPVGQGRQVHEQREQAHDLSLLFTFVCLSPLSIARAATFWERFPRHPVPYSFTEAHTWTHKSCYSPLGLATEAAQTEKTVSFRRPSADDRGAAFFGRGLSELRTVGRRTSNSGGRTNDGRGRESKGAEGSACPSSSCRLLLLLRIMSPT